MPSTPARRSKHLADKSQAKEKSPTPSPSPKKAKKARTAKHKTPNPRPGLPPWHLGESSFRKKTGTGSTGAKAKTATKKRAPGANGQAKGLTKPKCFAVYEFHSQDNKFQQTLKVNGDMVNNLMEYECSPVTFFGLDKEYCVKFKDHIVLPLDHDVEWLKAIAEETINVSVFVIAV